MADFSSKINIDASQAINQLDQLDKALGSTTVAMGTFQGVADKSIGGAGFAEVAKSADAFGKKASAAFDKTAKSAKTAQKSVQSIGLSFRDVGRIVESQIIFAAISGLTQGFRESADAAAEFQLQISRIAAISNDLNFDGAREAVEELAVELGRPLEEVGEAVFEGLQNDLGTTTETLNILREEAQQLALVTGGTLPQAVNALSSVYKTFGDDLGTTATASEQFFGTINAGRITLADLESSLGTLSPLAIQVGVTFKELTDSLATITLTGTQANVATTQLRNVLNKLIKPTERLKEVYQELGVQGFEELRRQQGGFVEALDALREEVGDSEDGLARLFNTIRGNVGVLNLLTNDTKLYEETAARASEAAGKLNDEISNIDNTAAREAARNAAELEVLYTRIGDRVLQFKVAAGDAFLAFIEQSNEAIALQTSLAAGVAAATVAVSKFGVAVGAAFPPLLAFTGIVGAGGGAVLVLNELAEAATSLQRETANLEVERLEAYLQSLKEIRAEEIREVTDEFERQDTVLSQVARTAQAAGEEIEKAFDIDTGRIRAVEAELLDAFGDARTRVLKQVEQAIKDIDDQILDGRRRIADIQQDLSDFSFEIRLEKLNEAQQVAERLKRSAETTAKAFEQAANVGLSEESADAARETAKTAVAQAKAALSAAKRQGEAISIRQAEVGVQEAMSSQLAVERQLVRLREGVSKKQLLDQQKAFEQLSAEARTQVQDVIDARKEIAEATRDGASDQEINKLKQELVSEVTEAREALIEAGQSEVLKTFGLEEQFDRAIQQLQEGLDQTQIDWNNALDDLKEQLASRDDFQAAVKLTAAIEGEASGNEELTKAIQDAIDAGGLPGERLQNAANAVKDTFVEQKNLQNEIQDASVKTELASAKARRAFLEATTELNSGSLEATKLTEPVLNQLSRLGDLNEEQLSQLIENLKSAIPAIAEQTTGLLGTFSDDQKFQLTQGIKAAIEAAQAQAESLEARKIFDPENLAAAESLLQKLSAGTVADLDLDLDEEGVKNVEEALKRIDTTAEFVELGFRTIGNVANGVTTSVKGIGQATLGLVGQANQAKGAYQQLLDIATQALQKAQQAAQQNAQNSANGLFFGGRPLYRNEGGPGRGQDTIPALLSPNEFVVNEKSAKTFLPELQAINAGNAPSSSGGGTGDTNITIGDINVSSSSNVPGQTGRDIAISIKRELRRGTTRL